MKAVEKGSAQKLPDPDHFKGGPEPFERLRNHIKHYKSSIGKMILLGSVGYFEAYCQDLFIEILEFHNSTDTLISKAVQKRNRAIQLADPKILFSKRKLQEPVKKGKEEKYQKYTKILSEAAYPLPTGWFGPYGIRCFEKAVKEARVVDLPIIFRDALGCELSKKEEDEFNKIRNYRNAAAHGKLTGFAFREALNANRFLRELSVKVDQHVVQHLLISELY